ncbi:MAG: histidine--tRNA ligase [Candidatus Dormibacteraeota bacterium]|nr:histidine--tRNA ligase [Candidatus Dormibacteraeota bacterium]
MAGISRPRGTEDLLPEPLARLNRVLAAGLQVAQAHGYRQIETPIFESTDLFVRGVGESTDVVTREMYTFPDRGGRSLTLRPEGTAPVVRAFWESPLRQDPLPVRISYAGPMFRYDRPGKGRYREFHQFGVEVLGESEPEVDAEVIGLAWRWLERLGVSGTSLQLNSLGDRECRPAYRAALLEFFEPRMAALPELDRERLRRNPLRVLDSKELAGAGILDQAPRTLDHLCSGCREAFERVQEALEALGIPFAVNHRLVRGLDYYARTAFEVWHQELAGAQNALFGGGRYDGLSELLGYPPLPGVGFAAGLERVAMISAPPPAPMGPELAVLSAPPADQKAAVALADRLRAAGMAVLLDAGVRGLRAKLSFAERSGVRLALILGESELRGRTVTVRRMSGRTQASVPLEGLEERLRALLGTGESAEEGTS